MIDFKTLCERAYDPAFWKPEASYCFKTVENYPHLFFTQFFKALKSASVVAVSSLTQADFPAMMASLQQSFLGQTDNYWLGNLDSEGREKSRVRKKELLQLLATYQGPHTVFFYCTDATALELAAFPKGTTTIISVPEKIDETMLQPLLKLLGFSFSPPKMKLLSSVFATARQVPLDTVCFMCVYLEVMSMRAVAESHQFLLSLVEPELSFIELSKHFFNRDAENFFKLWDKVGNEYPETYWILYWSDQLWRAYHVTTYLRQNKIVEAKKMGYRLPFAFAGHQWKKSSLRELRDGYQFLYHADCALKNGSSFTTLELFFMNYFSKSFEQ